MKNICPQRLAIFEQISNEHKGVNSAAQRQRFKAALTKLGSVLTFELSRFLSVYYPPARKHELVHDEGWDIVLSWERFETESGETHFIGRYTLKGLPTKKRGNR
jgi:hypothetical protein